MKSRIRPRALKLLIQGMKLSKYDLSLAAHCAPASAHRVLQEIHSTGIIHISSWTFIYRSRIPVYAWGSEKDTPRPPPVSDAKRMQEKRKDPSYRMDELMKKRAKRARERKVVSDWWELRRNNAS